MAPPKTSQPLTDRRILITGGSRRLGRAMALCVAKAGADVAIHYRRDETGARETVNDLVRRGVRAVSLQADLAHTEACAGLIAEAEAALGPLDVLINNAAMFERTPLETMTAEDFDVHMRANARSIYLLSTDMGRRMRARGSGVILNIADTAGLRPWPAFIPYSASKGTVVNLTRGFARALAPEVRVNAIAPGPMLPPAGEPPEQGEKAVAKTLLGRWGSPDDIAAAAMFLIQATYVTGIVLAVDGGRSLVM